jgi:hypothetical protein
LAIVYTRFIIQTTKMLWHAYKQDLPFGVLAKKTGRILFRGFFGVCS